MNDHSCSSRTYAHHLGCLVVLVQLALDASLLAFLQVREVPAALVDYLEDDSISVELWPGDHGVTSISKQDVIDMCLSADVFPPKTSRHTFAEPLDPIFVPLEELRDDEVRN